MLILRSIARAGSIAAAARELGWTQPAVSQHLRQLEREVGAPLVVRQARGVILTEAGAVAVEHADAIAARLHMAEEELAALVELRQGTVRLAAFPSASATLVPAALASISGSSPGLDLRLTEAEPPHALSQLQAGDVDLALVFSYSEPETPTAGMHSRQLGMDRVEVVLPREHALASRRRLELSALGDARWVAGCVRCRAHLLDVCRAAGFTPRISHSTDDYVVAQSLVAEGLAVALLPALALRSYRHPRVVSKPVASAGSRAISLVHRVDADRTPAVAAVIDAVTRSARVFTSEPGS